MRPISESYRECLVLLTAHVSLSEELEKLEEGGCERIRHLQRHQKGTGGVESARDVDGHALEPLEHIMQLAGSKMTNICICRLL